MSTTGALAVASVVCLLMALMRRGGAGDVPLPFAMAHRVPVPAAIAAALGGPDRPGDLSAAGLAGRLPPGALPRARCAMALLGLAPLPVVLLAPAALPVVALLAVLGWLVPGAALARAAARRRRVIGEQLPDVLELLGVCLGAGMSVDPALRVVVAHLPGPLASEVELALGEMALGATRRDAYLAIGRRVGMPGLDQAIAALVTAEELGTPLADALVRQAAMLRAAAAQDARDRAARAAPKVQLVVATMMVPAVMLLVVTVMAVELGRQIGPVLGGIG